MNKQTFGTNKDSTFNFKFKFLRIKMTRKYDSEHLKIGFSLNEYNNDLRPQCIIRYEIGANECVPEKIVSAY